MIYLTRLNGEVLAVNCELIEFIESTPDTVVSMTTGKKLVVTESIDEIIDRIIKYKLKAFNSCYNCKELQRNEV